MVKKAHKKYDSEDYCFLISMGIVAVSIVYFGGHIVLMLLRNGGI